MESIDIDWFRSDYEKATRVMRKNYRLLTKELTVNQYRLLNRLLSKAGHYIGQTPYTCIDFTQVSRSSKNIQLWKNYIDSWNDYKVYRSREKFHLVS